MENIDHQQDNQQENQQDKDKQYEQYEKYFNTFKFLKINVGGKIFQTTVSTLVHTSPYFKAFLSNKWQSINDIKNKDDNGILFLDKPSWCFELYLNWARSGATEKTLNKQIIKLKTNENPNIMIEHFYDFLNYIAIDYSHHSQLFYKGKKVKIYWEKESRCFEGTVISDYDDYPDICVHYEDGQIWTYNIWVLSVKQKLTNTRYNPLKTTSSYLNIELNQNRYNNSYFLKHYGNAKRISSEISSCISPKHSC